MFEDLPDATEMTKRTKIRGAEYQRTKQNEFAQTICNAIVSASDMGKNLVDVPYYTDRFSPNWNLLTNDSIDEVVEILENLGYDVTAHDVNHYGYFRVKW